MGNLLILTQNVSGAGNLLIFYDDFFYSTKHFVQDCYFHHLMSKHYVFDDSLTNVEKCFN